MLAVATHSLSACSAAPSGNTLLKDERQLKKVKVILLSFCGTSFIREMISVTIIFSLPEDLPRYPE